MTDPNKWFGCQHDKRFLLQTSFNSERPPYIYVCEYQCGFWLNFSPSGAGYIRDDTWWDKVMAYTNDSQGPKELPAMAPSRL